ncbi:hypothetical protein BJ165DRAFT_1534103 [Panaeolus papilionaceus]|nr:hypothetical protein BJ165DRAFT_1534103 [Panaeolus papilionaceus]
MHVVLLIEVFEAPSRVRVRDRCLKLPDHNHHLTFVEDGTVVGSDKLGIEVTKWVHHQDLSDHLGSDYQSLICNNLLARVANTQQQLRLRAEDKRIATTPGREDPLLLAVVLREEKVALDALQSFLDDLAAVSSTGRAALETLLSGVSDDADPSTGSSPWPNEASTTSLQQQQQSSHPPLPAIECRDSLSARVKGIVSPLKGMQKEVVFK